MSGEKWGPWIEWVQGPAPIGPGFLVQAEMGFVGSGDFVGPIPSQDFDWDCPGDPVARYRIRKPDALRGLIKDAKTLREPNRELEKA